MDIDKLISQYAAINQVYEKVLSGKDLDFSELRKITNLYKDISNSGNFMSALIEFIHKNPESYRKFLKPLRSLIEKNIVLFLKNKNFWKSQNIISICSKYENKDDLLINDLSEKSSEEYIKYRHFDDYFGYNYYYDGQDEETIRKRTELDEQELRYKELEKEVEVLNKKKSERQKEIFPYLENIFEPFADYNQKLILAINMYIDDETKPSSEHTQSVEKEKKVQPNISAKANDNSELKKNNSSSYNEQSESNGIKTIDPPHKYFDMGIAHEVFTLCNETIFEHPDPKQEKKLSEEAIYNCLNLFANVQLKVCKNQKTKTYGLIFALYNNLLENSQTNNKLTIEECENWRNNFFPRLNLHIKNYNSLVYNFLHSERKEDMDFISSLHVFLKFNVRTIKNRS